MAIIGVGIDLVDIDRAERMLERHRERVFHRFLLPAERTYVLTMARPARHLAVRLAAKEATYKALARLRGASAVSWRDIEVGRDRRGRPSIVLHGQADRVVAAIGRYRVYASLTHTDKTAGAVVVIEV
jgi:holo-[acyl-carrier protein] synthase